jgi:Secretion system C-terminal sorting domain
MRKLSILFCLALIASGCLLGQTLTVYPGDANNSRLCNHVDLLYVGLNYGLTGPARNIFPDTSWAPQQALAWGVPAVLDAAHSDCDGDGQIDRLDVTAIEGHFNFNTNPGTAPLADTTSIGSVNGPHLIVDLIQDSIFVQGAVQLTLAIRLGTPATPVDSIYGYAFTLDYDPIIVDAINFAFAPGNFAMDSAALNFFRVDTTLGKIYVSATNIDHQNRMGSGIIATVGIVMDDDIRISGLWSLLLTPSAFLGFTASAALVPVFPQGDTLTVITGRPMASLTGIDIYPNPATDQVVVRSAEQALSSLRLLDMQGRVLLENASPNPNFEIINTTQFPTGCYFLEVHARERVLRRKLVIQ